MLVSDVRFVKELYPRLKEIDALIEQYRTTIELLPPIIVARGGVLVDGYHRWQAHCRENVIEITAENLGDLSDMEILKESCKRNAIGVRALNAPDKKAMADRLYRLGLHDLSELKGILSLTTSTLETYLSDAKRDEKKAQKAKALDMHLDCCTQEQIANKLNITQKTVSNWLSNFRINPKFTKPPGATVEKPWGHIQHFDIWEFQQAADDDDNSIYGRMPPQVVENLLWFYTKPDDVVVDPFIGGGTTIDIAKAMGRRIWASDLSPRNPLLPIHQHNILDGWPDNAPSGEYKPNLILLDPPYWQQAKGRYSDDPRDLGNMPLPEFYTAWERIIDICHTHLHKDGRIAFIISPTQLDDEDRTVEDHTAEMLRLTDMRVERRIIVPYQTQQATGQQVTWARENKKMLKLYRDLVILR